MENGSSSEDIRLSFRFLLNPDWLRAGKSQHRLKGLAILFVCGFVGSLAAWQLFAAVSEAAGYTSILESELDLYSSWQQLLLVVLIAPVLEELTYRLPLQVNLSLPLVALSYAIGALMVAWPLIIISIICLSVWAVRPLKQSVENWWRDNPKWPIWIAVTIFGLVHLVNFEVDWSIGAILAAPFVVSPQLWLGLVFTIGRVRYGWFAGLGLHAAHNLTVWTLSTLIS